MWVKGRIPETAGDRISRVGWTSAHVTERVLLRWLVHVALAGSQLMRSRAHITAHITRGTLCRTQVTALRTIRRCDNIHSNLHKTTHDTHANIQDRPINLLGARATRDTTGRPRAPPTDRSSQYHRTHCTMHNASYVVDGGEPNPSARSVQPPPAASAGSSRLQSPQSAASATSAASAASSRLSRLSRLQPPPAASAASSRLSRLSQLLQPPQPLTRSTRAASEPRVRGGEHGLPAPLDATAHLVQSYRPSRRRRVRRVLVRIA